MLEYRGRLRARRRRPLFCVSLSPSSGNQGSFKIFATRKILVFLCSPSLPPFLPYLALCLCLLFLFFLLSGKKTEWKTANEIVSFIWFPTEFQVPLLIYKTKLWRKRNTEFRICMCTYMNRNSLKSLGEDLQK